MNHYEFILKDNLNDCSFQLDLFGEEAEWKAFEQIITDQPWYEITIENQVEDFETYVVEYDPED